MGELSEGQRLVLAAAEDFLAGASVCVLQPTPAAEPSDRRADPGMLLQPDMAAGTHNRVVSWCFCNFYLESCFRFLPSSHADGYRVFYITIYNHVLYLN